MRKLLACILFLSAEICMAAGTVTVTKAELLKGSSFGPLIGETVTVAWTADAAAATVPNTEIAFRGFLVKVVTKPGAVAPTDNYDVSLGDPLSASFDSLGAALNNLDTANTEQFYPVVSGATLPVYLNGTYTFTLSNNAVNSATGTLVFYLMY
jgi:hypothetical protein